MLHMGCYVHDSVPHSLPDPVPLEKDSDSNPIRIDIPKPVLDDYITVSYAYTRLFIKEIVVLISKNIFMNCLK